MKMHDSSEDTRLLDFEEDFEISPEWLEEIRRRYRQIKEGTALLIPSEQVFDEVDKALEDAALSSERPS